MVLDEDGVDAAVLEKVEEYAEECILPRIPDDLVPYFGVKAWVMDNLSDTGGWLASYDGQELVFNLGSIEIYIYRQ